MFQVKSEGHAVKPGVTNVADAVQSQSTKEILSCWREASQQTHNCSVQCDSPMTFRKCVQEAAGVQKSGGAEKVMLTYVLTQDPPLTGRA